jgi:hypothetical protein
MLVAAQPSDACMRQLLSIIHLVVTVGVSYSLPWMFLAALVGYFPKYPESADTPTLVVLGLGFAFLGGTILGRTREWRGHIVWIVALLWANAVVQVAQAFVAGTSARRMAAGIADAVLVEADVVLLALGMSIGLQVGARFMRPFEPARKEQNV